MFTSADLEKKYIHIIVHHLLKDGTENPQDYVFRFTGKYAFIFESRKNYEKTYKLMNANTKTKLSDVKVVGYTYSHEYKKLDNGMDISKQIQVKSSSKGEYSLWVSVNKNPD